MGNVNCFVFENGNNIEPKPVISKISLSKLFVYAERKQLVSLKNYCNDWIKHILLSPSYKILYFDQNENEILIEQYQCDENEKELSIPVKNDNFNHRKVKLMFDDDEKENVLFSLNLTKFELTQ